MSESRMRREHGFLVIAGVFLIVVLAALIGYLLTVSTTSQTASAADLNSARAYQAARAGIEWGVWRILRGPAGAGTFEKDCETATQTRNIAFGSELSAFTATVTCSSTNTTEGAATVTTYTLLSNACNLAGGPCPMVGTPGTNYVEREVRLTVTK